MSLSLSLANPRQKPRLARSRCWSQAGCSPRPIVRAHSRTAKSPSSRIARGRRAGAYLKLWETFTRIGVRPLKGDRCIDLGSAPGGWTFVLAKLGAIVTSVDKAELDPGVLALPGVTQLRQSAFGIDPRTAEPVDWLFSDVICYPDRMLRLVTQWLETGKARRFVVTLKFQGETDLSAIEAFRAIPGATVMHLHNNKHELTFVKL